MQKIIASLLLPRVFAGPLTIILLAAAAIPAQAENDFWTGANSQPGIVNDPTHWSNPYNWSPTAFITADPSTILNFNAASSSNAINDLGTFVLNKMNLNIGIMISGNPLSFQGASSGIVQNAAAPVTVANNLTLNATSSFSMLGSGTGNVGLTGVIAGSGSLTVNGNYTTFLDNTSNSYAGGTIIRGGSLSSIGTLPVGRDLTVQAGTLYTTSDSVGNLTLSDPSTTSNSAAPEVKISNSGSLTLGGNVTYNPSSSAPGASIGGGTLNLGGAMHTFSITAGNLSSYDMVIEAKIAGSGGLTVTGNGSLGLTQPSSFSGPVTLDSGNLFLGVTNAVQSAVTVNGGFLSFSPFYGAQGVTIGDYNQSFGSLSGSGGLVSLSTASLTVGTDNTNTSYAGHLSGYADTTSGKFGTLIKVGTGTLTLSQSGSLYSMPSITVNGGVLAVVDDGTLGNAGYAYSLTVNNAGTLRYAANATTARTFTLSGGTLEAAAGTTLILNSATVDGGFLRGPGTFALTGNTQLFGGVTLNSANISVAGSATVTNFNNGGSLTASAGKVFNWNGGTNASSGAVTVDGVANVTNFTSNGQISIHSGGGIYNVTSNLVLGGGSRTTVDSSGILDAGSGTTIELNGGLLVNNGAVVGTTDVNYGSLAKGTGVYGLVNVSQGGVLAPGNSPGIVTAAAVNFDNTPVSSGASTLRIELAGTIPGTQYDQLHVTGLLSLGGTLSVVLDNSFAPSAGNSFDILDWGTRTGTFSSVQLPTLAAGSAWDTSHLYTTGVISVIATTGVAGDYNGNGVVDAADYITWRNNQGTTHVLPNDPIGGTIGAAQYNQWRSHFGQTAGGGSGATTHDAVPEPATFVLLMCVAGIARLLRGRVG